MWTGLIWLKTWTSEGQREHGIAPSGSIKFWEIFEQLQKWRLFKVSAPVPESSQFTMCIFSETVVSKCPSRPTAHNGGSMMYETQLQNITAILTLQFLFLETKRQRHRMAPVLAPLSSLIACRGRAVSTGRWPDRCWMETVWIRTRTARAAIETGTSSRPDMQLYSRITKVPGNRCIPNKRPGTIPQSRAVTELDMGGLFYGARLDTWTVVHMTAAKFKPLIFSVTGFAVSNVANIFLFMILDDFCLLPAWFCYVIINIWHMKSHMHISNRCAPRKIVNGAEIPILQALQFQ
jgi:hypothetical protein